MWYDDWLPNGKLCEQVNFVDIHDTQTRVKDVCSAVVQDLLLSITPFLCEGVNDTIVWGTSLSGQYTVRDAYYWLLHRDRNIVPVKPWAWLWKLQPSESVRFMLWKAASDLLPTRELLQNRHLCNVATFSICQHGDEDVLHCLRNCVAAGSVWNALGFATSPPFIQLDNAFDWIQWSVGTFGSLFLAGLIDLFIVFLALFLGFHLPLTTLALMLMVALWGTRVELLAILHGLALAWEYGFRFVSLWSDSKLALSLIAGPTHTYHKYAAILGKIASLINQEWTVTFEHILREGNSCVDWFAKLGAKSSSALERVLHPPLDLALLLDADARGVSFVRH
ncbi:Ribonuclease H-like superfamily [Sesbania bispinosa]|nr:Ribonuclease H-like superfamily [Sesbania bispinosa]